tara:strand:- start:135 stop:686 length:552 start_codon:yes stop_codon:yes gene_type:complete
MVINRHHSLSPIQIIDLKLGIPQNYKQECINEIYKIGNSVDGPTNLTSLRSTYQVWKETKVLNILIGNILTVLHEITPPHDERYYYDLVNAWSAIYKKGHYAKLHCHIPAHISFVYYFKSTGNTPLIFDECNFKLNPTDDTLVIFPSYLKHSVPPHNDKEDRICLAGNVWWELKQNKEWNNKT